MRKHWPLAALAIALAIAGVAMVATFNRPRPIKYTTMPEACAAAPSWSLCKLHAANEARRRMYQALVKHTQADMPVVCTVPDPANRYIHHVVPCPTNEPRP